MSNATIRRTSHGLRTSACALCVLGLCLLVAGCASTPPGNGTSLDMAATTPTRTTVVHAAADVLGTPYRAHANGPRAFSDNGLVQYAYARAGIALPLAPHALLGAGPPIAMANAQPGDLVFYQTHLAGGDDSLRVGLYLNEHEMLYASARRDEVVIQSIDGDYWRGRLLGVVRVLSSP